MSSDLQADWDIVVERMARADESPETTEGFSNVTEMAAAFDVDPAAVQRKVDALRLLVSPRSA